jgi:thioredoxin 1
MLEVNTNNFKQEVLESSIPVVVDFWAPWCNPCKKMTPVIEELAQVYKDKVKFVKLNIEQASSIASSYMVMSIPTLIIFKEGKPYQKKTGLISHRDLEKFINNNL